ncbi:MAG: YqeG family HAD IIIA-type phosphatase [Bacilli bacterium]|nr:YqeG family HAD IIIA-type phosphatase [Bacilli bacterium]
MKNYLPNMYQESIFTIPYDTLKEKGITLLLFDLDNTITPAHMKTAEETVKQLFHTLKEKGFTVVIFSNSPNKRVKPFSTFLEVSMNGLSFKPMQRSFKKMLKKYNTDKKSTAIIGDQLMTDIVGGNKAGIYTVLVNPLTVKDMILTWYNRYKEKKIFETLYKEQGFERGKYYE